MSYYGPGFNGPELLQKINIMLEEKKKLLNIILKIKI